MPKYIAVRESYGWLRRHWKVDQISPETNETPPVSKYGLLFREVKDGDPPARPSPTEGMPGMNYGPAGVSLPNYPGMQNLPSEPPAVAPSAGMVDVPPEAGPEKTPEAVQFPRTKGKHK